MPIYPDMAPYLFHEGTNSKCYEYFGAHPTQEGKWIFRVWAPAAKAVSVTGDFCGWDRNAYPMTYTHGGIWETKISDIHIYDNYQYCILTQDGRELMKADPYGFHSATRPETASKIFDLEGFPWRDGKWMKQRELIPPYQKPLNIYELHAGSWQQHFDGNVLNYRELADRLIPYIKKMNYTHIELMPLTEYPFDKSWGYQVTGYFAPTSRYGTPHDLMYLVDACHRANIGVIMDWVPAHFPRDAMGLFEFDGGPCYEYSDPLKMDHPDWGTRIFDFGKKEVMSFLQSSAQFWLEKYHIDGLRVDAVASMLYLDYGKGDSWRPNIYGGNENLEAVELLKRLNTLVHAQNKGIMMIAEESTAWPLVTAPVDVGGLGFDFKWNMGWMNDTLRFMAIDPMYRGYHMNQMTFSLCYAFSENYILPLSHDEVVHGKCSLLSKMPGEYEEKFANLRTYFAYMLGHPGKKMLFMGGEFGQFIEWNEEQELDWKLLEYPLHSGLQQFVAELNKLYLKHKALNTPLPEWEGFQWIAADDTEHTVLSFRVNDGKEEIVCVYNLSGAQWNNYSIGVPYRGNYKRILSTDDEAFGGQGRGNDLLVADRKAPMHGQKQSITLDLPPLSAQFFVHKIYQNKKNS